MDDSKKKDKSQSSASKRKHSDSKEESSKKTKYTLEPDFADEIYAEMKKNKNRPTPKYDPD